MQFSLPLLEIESLFLKVSSLVFGLINDMRVLDNSCKTSFVQSLNLDPIVFVDYHIIDIEIFDALFSSFSAVRSTEWMMALLLLGVRKYHRFLGCW